MNNSAGFDLKQVRQGEGSHVFPQSCFGNTASGGNLFRGDSGTEGLSDCRGNDFSTGEQSPFECLCALFCVDFIECNLSHGF
jgi:hypothetical protein